MRLSKAAEDSEVMRRLAYWNGFNFGSILQEGCDDQHQEIIMYTMAGLGAYGSDRNEVEGR